MDRRAELGQQAKSAIASLSNSIFRIREQWQQNEKPNLYLAETSMIGKKGIDWNQPFQKRRKGRTSKI